MRNFAEIAIVSIHLRWNGQRGGLSPIDTGLRLFARWDGEIDLTLMSSVWKFSRPSPSAAFYEVLPGSVDDFHCRGQRFKRGEQGRGCWSSQTIWECDRLTNRNQEAGITSWYLDPTRAAAVRLSASAWKLGAALTDRSTFHRPLCEVASRRPRRARQDLRWCRTGPYNWQSWVETSCKNMLYLVMLEWIVWGGSVKFLIFISTLTNFFRFCFVFPERHWKPQLCYTDNLL